MMRKLILTCFQCPGDVVMLTAAVRDLHACYPGKYLTDVRTGCPEIWENNPHLTPLKMDDPEVEIIPCEYPLIEQSNQRRVHFLHGYIGFLNVKLGLEIKLTRFHGDIHLSESERSSEALPTRFDHNGRYWVIVAGGKFDYTIKWWHFRRWQAVVDELEGEVSFVQVGEESHYHPPLHKVFDLRGKTSLRELILLIHRADGVLCPVTMAMHLAAAVGCADFRRKRACVVVAGGREPATWEAYPDHRYIHTIGQLPCCAAGGCWRSRSVPIGDGDAKDQPEQLCVDVVNNLPRCMHMITPELVVQRIRESLEDGREIESANAKRDPVRAIAGRGNFAEIGKSQTKKYYANDRT